MRSFTLQWMRARENEHHTPSRAELSEMDILIARHRTRDVPAHARNAYSNPSLSLKNKGVGVNGVNSERVPVVPP
jgi:hypothetical protein